MTVSQIREMAKNFEAFSDAETELAERACGSLSDRKGSFSRTHLHTVDFKFHKPPRVNGCVKSKCVSKGECLEGVV